MADAAAFDVDRAAWFRPNPDLVKTAVLVDVIDPNATTVIHAPFGVQRLRGPFYAVADREESYGASQREFEAAHTSVGANRWIKTEPVMAYRSDVACTIRTLIDDHEEARVDATPGDWIVRQPTGEVIVLKSESFDMRYDPMHVD